MSGHFSADLLAHSLRLSLIAAFTLGLMGCTDAPSQAEHAAAADEHMNPLGADAGAAVPKTLSPADVDLTPGVYVFDSSSCQDPANSEFLIWSGQGFSGAKTTACTLEGLSQSEGVISGQNLCTDRTTQTMQGADVHFQVQSADEVQFESTDWRSMHRCSDAELPEWLAGNLKNELNRRAA